MQIDRPASTSPDGLNDVRFAEARQVALDIVANVEKVMVGKKDLVRLAATALLCRGHILIDGRPGVGKTILARSLARSVGGTFKRIQGTADLLPSDLTGVYVFDQRSSDFRFRPGPIMAHIVLVDEINRASPRTQSALLECMEERQVTVDGVTHPMPETFLVLATRNPSEHDGTFPMPDTELDRFLVRLELDYPTAKEEEQVLAQQLPVHPLETIEPVVDSDQVVRAQQTARCVAVDSLVNQYIVAIVNATRAHPAIRQGGSPRASLGIQSLAQAWAMIEGRSFATPDDVKAVASAALAHRTLPAEDRPPDVTTEQVIQQILQSVPVPGASAWRGPSPSFQRQERDRTAS